MGEEQLRFAGMFERDRQELQDRINKRRAVKESQLHAMKALVEAYFDGAVEPVNPGGHGTWGAVVKVDGKNVYAESGYCGSGSSISNNVAEYAGALAALKVASGYEGRIILRGDSKLVIMQLSGQWQAHAGLYKPHYLEAKKLYDSLRGRITAEWIPRAQNEECDALSKRGLADRGVEMRIQPEGGRPKEKRRRWGSGSLSKYGGVRAG